MKNKIKNLLIFIILLLSAIIIVGSIYYYQKYPEQDFDVILFTFSAGIEHTSPAIVNSIILSCIIPISLLLTILILPTIRNFKKNICINIKFKQKK